MTADTSPGANVCPDCGAELANTAGDCWLCRQSQAPTDEASTRFVHAERVAPPRPAGGHSVEPALVTLMLVVALVAVLIGVATETLGVAIILILAALPILLATMFSSGEQAHEGPNQGFAQALTKFFASLAVTVFAVFGIIATIIVVVVVAVFVACLGAMSGGF